jgi:thioredoxin-related protein
MFLSILLLIVVFSILFYLFNRSSNVTSESFNTSTNTKINILVFLSSSCGHCTTYKNNMNSTVQQFATSNGYGYEIVPESDGEKFTKYNIEYIPTCIIVKGNDHKKLNGEITIANIQNTIKSM